MAEQVVNAAAPQEVNLQDAQKKTEAKKGKGKRGREKRKRDRRGSPISLYVKDKITAEAYFKATNQRVNR